ncbi:hypothetical protein HY256_09150, partial [Candidatus Sumerlaeota bacterium]|nr:hypothetical protein [Candidatus Sumerlaeota bacterium]
SPAEVRRQADELRSGAAAAKKWAAEKRRTIAKAGAKLKESIAALIKGKR